MKGKYEAHILQYTILNKPKTWVLIVWKTIPDVPFIQTEIKTKTKRF